MRESLCRGFAYLGFSWKGSGRWQTAIEVAQASPFVSANPRSIRFWSPSKILTVIWPRPPASADFNLGSDPVHAASLPSRVVKTPAAIALQEPVGGAERRATTTWMAHRRQGEGWVHVQPYCRFDWNPV